MKPVIFMDTSAFIAQVDLHDQYHPEALRLQADVEKLGRKMTSTFVVTETAQYIQRHRGVAPSHQFLSAILSGDAGVDMVYPEKVDLERAYKISCQYADQAFSFVDCTSFAVIERLKISRAYSFDKDFLIFKFSHGPLQRIPSQPGNRVSE